MSWSILGLVDLYDAIWGGEYQNDLGVAIASLAMMIITSWNFYKPSLGIKASKWQLIHEDNDLAPWGCYYFYDLIGIRWWM